MTNIPVGLDDEYMWAQKFRPQSIKDCILPKGVKDKFIGFIKESDIPNLLFTSSKPGTGKTTSALALCNDLGFDTLFINASDERGIDTLRNKVKNFVSTVSIVDGHKVVILDEADSLTDAAQSALRSMMETFSSNARFIITGNRKNKIIDPIRSRCLNIDFVYTDNEKVDMIKQMTMRCIQIIKVEGVKCKDPIAVGKLVVSKFPDNRSILNILHGYSKENGVVDLGILSNIKSADVEEILKFIKEKDFGAMRQWVQDNADSISDTIYDKLFKLATLKLEVEAQVNMIKILNDYQRNHNTVPSMQVHFASMITEMFFDVEVK